eukprot:6905637-Pyramimonas_sp.AAC.2
MGLPRVRDMGGGSGCPGLDGVHVHGCGCVADVLRMIHPPDVFHGCAADVGGRMDSMAPEDLLLQVTCRFLVGQMEVHIMMFRMEGLHALLIALSRSTCSASHGRPIEEQPRPFISRQAHPKVNTAACSYR